MDFVAFNILYNIQYSSLRRMAVNLIWWRDYDFCSLASWSPIVITFSIIAVSSHYPYVQRYRTAWIFFCRLLRLFVFFYSFTLIFCLIANDRRTNTNNFPFLCQWRRRRRRRQWMRCTAHTKCRVLCIWCDGNETNSEKRRMKTQGLFECNVTPFLVMRWLRERRIDKMDRMRTGRNGMERVRVSQREWRERKKVSLKIIDLVWCILCNEQKELEIGRGRSQMRSCLFCHCCFVSPIYCIHAVSTETTAMVIFSSNPMIRGAHRHSPTHNCWATTIISH